MDKEKQELKNEIGIWEHPNHYLGYSPDGLAYVGSIHRDSNILEQSNYECVKSDLERVARKAGYNLDENEIFDTWSADHFLVGWIEHTCLFDNAPVECFRALYEWKKSLEYYPVADDGDYSERQYNAICECWERMSMSDRIEYACRAGISIFSSRRDDIPPEILDEMSQSSEFF